MTVFDGTVLEDFQTECQMYDRTTADDGFGGLVPSWSDGATFIAAMIAPSGGTADIAKALTEKKTYKLVTGTNVTLRKDDYFKRLEDGKTFRVMNDNTDKLAPEWSMLQMRATTAEEAELPHD